MSEIINIIENEIQKFLVETDYDYRGEHTAPSSGGDDVPMCDLTKLYPDDIYGNDAARSYAHYGDNRDYEAISIIQSVRNNPNARVKIYRAVPNIMSNQDMINDYIVQKQHIMKTGTLPHNVTGWSDRSKYYEWLDNEIERLKTIPEKIEEKPTINNGDWVTISRNYAKEHGKSNLKNNFKILTKTVPAQHLYTDANDIFEWGYNIKL